MSGARRPLVLHVDVNKTIIICDPVKSVGCDEMVGALLSEACWGTWDEAPAPADEEGKRLAAASWQLKAGPTVEEQPGMVTYAELLEDVLCMEKKELQALKSTFTEPGCPGESVRSSYEELRGQLRLPEGVTLPTAPASIGVGQHFLLPSFLRLVVHLQREGRDFRIVFRTFGMDIADVIAEFNLLCSGSHPCFPDVPEEMRSRMVSVPGGTGEWYRDASGVHLAICMRQKDTEMVSQVHGAESCAAALSKKLFEPPQVLTIALRDYFPYWRASKETDDSGKVLLVDPTDTAAPHHIFFDDNVERNRAHIVDVRNAKTGEAMPFAESKGVYLVKAEPMLAIRDPEYFIGAVAAAEAALSARFEG